MTFLLDVNVLIALVDPMHVSHDTAHAWFALEGQASWATCPLTENGVLRILGNPSYPNHVGPPSSVAPLLSAMRALPGHEFWADEISLTDCAEVEMSRLLGSAQVTDTYLLALAVRRQGQLATLDRRLVTSAVRHGSQALRIITAA